MFENFTTQLILQVISIVARSLFPYNVPIPESSVPNRAIVDFIVGKSIFNLNPSLTGKKSNWTNLLINTVVDGHE